MQIPSGNWRLTGNDIKYEADANELEVLVILLVKLLIKTASVV
jgi:hypothetical protein